MNKHTSKANFEMVAAIDDNAKATVFLHLSTSHLRINNIVIHRIETQQISSHLPVERE